VCRAMHDDPDAIIEMVGHTLGRGLLLCIPMLFFEKDPKKIVKQAFGASAAIEAFILTWNNLSNCEPLPSGDAAHDLLDEKPGAMGALIGTMAFRAAMIAVGISWAGEKNPRRLLAKSLAAVTLVEATVLWEASQNRKPVEEA